MTLSIAPLSAKESALLHPVNEWLSSDTWQQYQELREKFRAETISETEHQRLTEIYDQLENINAQRISFIADLARLHNVSLEEIMRELDITCSSHEYAHFIRQG